MILCCCQNGEMLQSSPSIVLSTLNAKYIHASLGLRYLLANLDRHGGAGLRAQTVLREFTIARPVQEIVRLADHLITGWGDLSFPKLCRALLYGPRPLMKVFAGEQPALAEIDL